MVMKRNAMRKNLLQSIWKSFGRYVAIAAIIGLGTALFLGLLMTKSDMVATGQEFMDRQNMFDIRLMGTYGWAPEQVEEAAKLDGIAAAEGVFYTDMIVNFGEDADVVYRLYAMPEKMNQLSLRGGRMPENAAECLVDGFHTDDSILGTKITISETNDEDDLEAVLEREITVVGYIASPLYMDMNRGNTSVGSGALTGYLYLPESCFDVDYYTEIHLTIPGDYAVYTDHYNDTLEAITDAIEPEAEALAWDRFNKIKAEAEEEYQDGNQEYLDGIKEYEDGKAEGEQELADALQELTDGEKEIKDNRKKLQITEESLYNDKIMLQGKAAEVAATKNMLQQQISALEAQKGDKDKTAAALQSSTGCSYTELIAVSQSGPPALQSIREKTESLKAKIAQLEAEPGRTPEQDAELASAKTSLTALGQEAAAIQDKLGKAAANASTIQELAE